MTDGGTRRLVRVVAGLIPDAHDSSRYLVQQRPAGTSNALLWEFPGGKVDPGESDEAALIREGQEELTVELLVGRLRWSGRHAYPTVDVDLVLYDARIISGLPSPAMGQILRFATPTEMRQLPFCEADLPILELLSAS